MTIRMIAAGDLTTLRWIDIPMSQLERVDWADTTVETGWWRIVAEISCTSCGAYQAADSDPTNDKQIATTLALALFTDVGWRVDELNQTVCGDCASNYGIDR
jgi:hypothetical protein